MKRKKGSKSGRTQKAPKKKPAVQTGETQAVRPEAEKKEDWDPKMGVD